jgi:hypothetical protein
MTIGRLTQALVAAAALARVSNHECHRCGHPSRRRAKRARLIRMRAESLPLHRHCEQTRRREARQADYAFGAVRAASCFALRAEGRIAIVTNVRDYGDSALNLPLVNSLIETFGAV